MMVVLFSLMFMSIIAYEIIYSSSVDLRISANARNRIQAWYLAQSSARLALLRLHIYKTAKNIDALAKQGNLLDKIWNFPLPTFPLPGQVYGTDHNLPGEMSAIIRSEGSLIPINLLDGNIHRNSSEEIADQVKKNFRQLVQSYFEDETFSEKYRDLRAEDLLNSLVDWIDEDNKGSDGGEELRDYESLDPPYEPRNNRIPVISELHMLKGWTDDLYNRIAPELSVIKTRLELNPNYLSLERIKSFHPKLTKEDLQVIEERRREEPFTSLDQLEKFIQSSQDIRNGLGFEFPEGIKSTINENVFRIEASGIVGLARRVIRLGVRMDEIVKKDKKAPESDPNPEDPPKDPDKKTEKKETKLGDPTVVSFEVLV